MDNTDNAVRYQVQILSWPNYMRHRKHAIHAGLRVTAWRPWDDSGTAAVVVRLRIALELPRDRVFLGPQGF